MRVALLALTLAACKPSLSERSVTASTNDLLQAQRELESTRLACRGWRLKAFSAEERKTISDELLHRWLGGTAPASPDGGVVDRPERPTATDERLTRLGHAVTHNLQGHAFSFLVVTDSALDTFSVPDGRVLVTRGLLDACATDAQLAGVVAHEAAHVFYEHALGVVRETAQTSCEVEAVSRVAMAATRAALEPQPEFAAMVPELDKANDRLAKRVADDLARQLAIRGYGTKEQAGAAQELQADRSAADWMHSAGYDIREYEGVLGKLEALSLPHPLTPERIAALEERRTALPPLPVPPKKKKK